MADEDTVKDVKKVHRERLSGRKAVKKKLKKEHGKEGAEKPKNTKAFTFNSAIRAERKFRRKQDLKTKKQHIPVVDRTPLEPPPIVVGVVGPPKVGKSTLIRCIIKSFTRQPLSTIKGPVTVVTGKKRRITLIECNNDINSMVDLAKVVDLVLLLIDASFGFEMEIFEFLNICQVHGMPKIMGVLTHLDMIKQTKKLQKTKKLLKRRFWTEVYAGAKLFYLSGLLHDAYLRNEIKNLARFISVMKFRPLVWQTTHSYVLADRIEDLTPPEQIRVNPKGDRTVCIYGYVRGIPLNENSFIHIPGCGDFVLNDICFLPDPCPLPQERKKRSLIEKERLIYAPFSGVGGIVYDKDAVYIEVKRGNANVKQPHKEMIDSILEIKETMDDKLEKSTLRLFPNSAPITSSEFEQMQSQVKSVEDGERKPINMNSNSGVKRKRFDFDSDSGDDDELESDEDENERDSRDGKEEGEEGEENSLIKSALQREEEVRYRGVQTEKDKSIHDKISEALAVLDSKEQPCEEWSECSSSDDEKDEGVGESEDEKLPWEKKDSDDEASDDEESNEDSEDDLQDTDLNWKTNLAEKAAMAFIERQASDRSLWKLVYGESVSGEGDEEEEDDDKDEVGGLFKVVRQKQEDLARNKDKLNAVDCSRFSGTQVRDWSLPQVENSIKDCFVTGKWKKEDDASELLKLDDMEDSEDEMFGDFEDLETGEKFEAKKQDKNAENTEGGEPKEELTKEQLMEKKKKLKEKFDKEYDNKDDDETTYFDELKSEANKQAELNRSQFEGLDDSVRVKLEGFRAGMYVRMEVNNVSPEIIENFDPAYPLIVGGLQPGEQNVGFVKVRIKKHRWYHKILKTKDPLIMSLGWRRFQTLTVYSKQEDDMRHRMLKYTPEHVNCMGHFWGPITRAGTGFLALQSVNINEMRPGFRIVATGTVVDTNQSTVVTKKLKLTGVPMKIYKKTAFIRGMFNSTLEVAKFEGAKIKTVSGIRGQIKRAVSKPEGAFRATFEDKILLSDIVFCRTWYKVDIPKFYAPVTTLLLPPDQKNSWTGMKTLGQLKRERGIQNESQPDSMYTQITRTTKAPLPLKVPRALEKELPYKYKLKGKALSEKEKIKTHTYKKELHGPFMKKVGKIVIRDEYDSKVASMMDKLRMSFEAKQEKLKEETHQRIRQHQKQIRDEERKKFRRQRELKKDIFKALSKMEIQKQKKMGKSKRPRK